MAYAQRIFSSPVASIGKTTVGPFTISSSFIHAQASSSEVFIECDNTILDVTWIDGVGLAVSVYQKREEPGETAIKHITGGSGIDLMQDVLTEYAKFVRCHLSEEQIRQADQIVHNVIRRHDKQPRARLEKMGLTTQVPAAAEALSAYRKSEEPAGQ